jgi:hypothetical protein
MSDRSKTPTLKTAPEAPKAKRPAMIGAPTIPEVRDSMEDMATHVFDSGNFKKPPAEDADTFVDRSGEMRAAPRTLQGHESPLVGVGPRPEGAPPPAPAPAPPKIQAKSMKDDGTFRQEVSTPIKVVSMKTPGQSDRPDTPARAMPQVKLRAMSEVQSQKHALPENLGYLAPPRDAREVRARRTGELVIWASVCVMIACAIALGIWFLGK